MRHKERGKRACTHIALLMTFGKLEKVFVMQALLREYAVSADAEEAARCLRELAVPYYHHELVKKALEVAFDTASQSPAIMDLLATFAASSEINQVRTSLSMVARSSGLHWLSSIFPLTAQFQAEGPEH